MAPSAYISVSQPFLAHTSVSMDGPCASVLFSELVRQTTQLYKCGQRQTKTHKQKYRIYTRLLVDPRISQNKKNISKIDLNLK